MSRILIVDDEEVILEMLIQMVNREGYEAEGAKNGKEAMKKIAENKPDLLITDLIMPDKEGIELIKDIRASYKDLKILAISGGNRHIDPMGQLKIARFLGADASLSKPLDRKEFLSVIKNLIG
ncbi:MAG: response regulator [Calditrichae bacterium]|nr:response regulator [Calditrichota bacterium]MCB9058340.1 response regulator [Calditrichia bacterium]